MEETEIKELKMRLMQLESALRTLMKIKEKIGIFNEEKFNRILDEYNDILRKIKK